MKPEQPDPTSPNGEPRAANEPVVQPETMPSLEELLREAELKAAEHHDAWLRAKAEAENVRKRASEDVAKAHKFGIEKFAADLLAVKDSRRRRRRRERHAGEPGAGGVQHLSARVGARAYRSAS
jgi:molecular chaperone GrpE